MERNIEKGWDIEKDWELSFAEMSLRGMFLGSDLVMYVWGGQKPHIGCTVQAVPRPSLTGDGSVGVTSSVLNLTGHKDEAICRALAETMAKRTGGVVVCTGGFHVDHMTTEQIREVLEAVKEV